MDKLEVLRRLRVYIYTNYKNQKEYAEDNNVPSSMVSAILNGHKEPTKRMFEQAGVVKKVIKTVTYEQA